MWAGHSEETTAGGGGGGGEAAEHLGLRHGPLQMPEQDIKST